MGGRRSGPRDSAVPFPGERAGRGSHPGRTGLTAGCWPAYLHPSEERFGEFGRNQIACQSGGKVRRRVVRTPQGASILSGARPVKGFRTPQCGVIGPLQIRLLGSHQSGVFAPCRIFLLAIVAFRFYIAIFLPRKTNGVGWGGVDPKYAYLFSHPTLSAIQQWQMYNRTFRR